MGRTSIEKAEFWRFVVREQSRSGLNVREFCHQEGMSEASLYQWRKKLASTTGTSKPVDLHVGSPEFLPVNIVPASPADSTADDDAEVLNSNRDFLVAVVLNWRHCRSSPRVDTRSN